MGAAGEEWAGFGIKVGFDNVVFCFRSGVRLVDLPEEVPPDLSQQTTVTPFFYFSEPGLCCINEIYGKHLTRVTLGDSVEADGISNGGGDGFFAKNVRVCLKACPGNEVGHAGRRIDADDVNPTGGVIGKEFGVGGVQPLQWWLVPSLAVIECGKFTERGRVGVGGRRKFGHRIGND